MGLPAGLGRTARRMGTSGRVGAPSRVGTPPRLARTASALCLRRSERCCGLGRQSGLGLVWWSRLGLGWWLGWRFLGLVQSILGLGRLGRPYLGTESLVS